MSTTNKSALMKNYVKVQCNCECFQITMSDAAAIDAVSSDGDDILGDGSYLEALPRELLNEVLKWFPSSETFSLLLTNRLISST
mgnify:CR=1 FL=1